MTGTKTEPKKHLDFAFPTVLVGLLALCYLAYDIWLMAAGRVDLNQHLPFFMPLVLGLITVMSHEIYKRS